MNVRVNPHNHPHLERGALIVGATAALFAVWLGIGLPGAPFAPPGLASGKRESPSMTELYARTPNVARPHNRVPLSTNTLHWTRSVSTSRLVPAPPPAAPVVRAVPAPPAGGATTERTAKSSPKNDPQHATGADAPVSPLPTPPPDPPTVSDVPTTVEAGLNTVTDLVQSTVSTAQSAVPAVLDAADAAQVPNQPSLLPGSTKLPGLP